MLPTDERRRLSALRLYRILDTAPEKAFDDFTRLAASICETPISLVSLLDKDRQWFKSNHGFTVRETPRDQAFCAHAISHNEIMVVEDATKDERFFNNPLVVGEPEIRFYAGAPLEVENGCRLGTLCVIDRKPRVLSEAQLSALAVLRDAVVTQLKLRRAADDLEAIANLLPMCAWCRKVRTGEEAADLSSWRPLHEYVADLNAVSHGVCPECQENLSEDPR